MEVNWIRIANIKVLANETKPWAIPKGCQWFTLQCREAKNVKISMQKDMEVYFTVKSGTKWREKNLDIKERVPIWFNPGGNNVNMEMLLGIREEQEG